MNITIPQDEAAAKAASSSSSKPIPAGKYVATIVPSKKDSSTVEVVAVGGNGPDSQKPMLNVQFRLVDGQGHDNRRVFHRIPLFTKWTSTAGGKYPDGTPAFDYFSFFGALGYDVNQPGGFTVPNPTEFLGKAVEIAVIVKAPDEYNPDGKNEVKYINKATTTADAVAPTTVIPQDVWAQAQPTTPAASDAVWNPTGPTL